MKEFIEKLIGRLKEKENKAVLKAPNTSDISNIEYQKWMMKSYGFKESIEIINQLAEEYKNDFCEWKKTDKRESSPYHHALKHGNITLEFHDDFKFCPYCGKKIKVVE